MHTSKHPAIPSNDKGKASDTQKPEVIPDTRKHTSQNKEKTQNQEKPRTDSQNKASNKVIVAGGDTSPNPPANPNTRAEESPGDISPERVHNFPTDVASLDFKRWVYHFSIKILSSIQDREDLFIDVCIRTLEGKFLPTPIGIKQRCWEILRWKKVRSKTHDVGLFQEVPRDSPQVQSHWATLALAVAATPTSDFIETERLHKALDMANLSEEDGLLIYYIYYRGLTYAQITDLVGGCKSNVTMRMQKIKERIKQFYNSIKEEPEDD